MRWLNNGADDMKTQTINPVFSDKHKAYISRAETATVSVAEGAVRAGKTIDNVLALAKEINRGTPDRIHLANGENILPADVVYFYVD